MVSDQNELRHAVCHGAQYVAFMYLSGFLNHYNIGSRCSQVPNHLGGSGGCASNNAFLLDEVDIEVALKDSPLLLSTLKLSQRLGDIFDPVLDHGFPPSLDMLPSEGLRHIPYCLVFVIDLR